MYPGDTLTKSTSKYTSLGAQRGILYIGQEAKQTQTRTISPAMDKKYELRHVVQWILCSI